MEKEYKQICDNKFEPPYKIEHSGSIILIVKRTYKKVFNCYALTYIHFMKDFFII